MQRGQEKEIKGFTDIHAHFLYDLDDGAKNQREMEAMLDAAHREGIATLYATPHTTPGVQPFDGALYTQRLEEARSYCRKKGYEVRLNTGAETYAHPPLSDMQGKTAIYPRAVRSGANRVYAGYCPKQHERSDRVAGAVGI